MFCTVSCQHLMRLKYILSTTNRILPVLVLKKNYQQEFNHRILILGGLESNDHKNAFKAHECKALETNILILTIWKVSPKVSFKTFWVFGTKKN